MQIISQVPASKSYLLRAVNYSNALVMVSLSSITDDVIKTNSISGLNKS